MNLFTKHTPLHSTQKSKSRPSPIFAPILSLALTSTMLLTTLPLPTEATNFHDQDQISNTMAVDVITALGVMVGDENNNFNPQEPVTRAEMAVICTTMLFGANFPHSSFQLTHVFTDVPDWATGFVNAAASQNIISGYGDGTFGSDTPVTSIDALLMLMKTVGYFQNPDEFGTNWELNVLSKATSLGFFQQTQNDNAHAPLTREDVATFIFHAMTALAEVDYNQAFGAYYNRGKSMTYGVDNTIYEDTLGYKFKTWS